MPRGRQTTKKPEKVREPMVHDFSPPKHHYVQNKETQQWICDREKCRFILGTGGGYPPPCPK